MAGYPIGMEETYSVLGVVIQYILTSATKVITPIISDGTGVSIVKKESLLTYYSAPYLN